MTPQEIEAALAEPFSETEVKFKPGKVSGNRAMALAYVDARVVQDRLDDVLGVSGWQDSYTPADNGTMLCTLKVRIGDEWITKTDIGGESEQPDGGDRMKAAVSDALKRAAVKFGVGRYLYRLPAQWADWDAQKRAWVKPPTLATVARPEPRPASWAKDIESGAAILAVAIPKGYEATRLAWEGLSPNQRHALKPFITIFRALAQQFDAIREEANTHAAN